MLRGEIWQLSLGNKKTPTGGESRLVVILSNDALGVLPLRVVIPLTPWLERYNEAPWMVRIPPVLRSGLDETQAADTLQIRSVSSSRLVKQVGELPENMMDEIIRALNLVIQTGVAQGDAV